MSVGIPPAAAYDRAITIFAPDGRIYQVEYAFESVRRGWTTLGIRSKDGVVVIVHKKKTSTLIDEKMIQKIFIVDEHIGATFAGIASDGRVLVEYARQQALLHRFYYDEPIPVEYLAKQICDVKQAYTQHAGVRPFGVAIVLAGVDEDGPRLFMTEPSGAYAGYYVVSIGAGSQQVTEFFEKNFSEKIELETGIVMALRSLDQVIEGGIDPTKVEVATVDVKTRKFKKLSTEEVSGYISKVKAGSHAQSG